VGDLRTLQSGAISSTMVCWLEWELFCKKMEEGGGVRRGQSVTKSNHFADACPSTALRQKLIHIHTHM
jgi:hypothetical protein